MHHNIVCVEVAKQRACSASTEVQDRKCGAATEATLAQPNSQLVCDPTYMLREAAA